MLGFRLQVVPEVDPPKEQPEPVKALCRLSSSPPPLLFNKPPEVSDLNRVNRTVNDWAKWETQSLIFTYQQFAPIISVPLTNSFLLNCGQIVVVRKLPPIIITRRCNFKNKLNLWKAYPSNDGFMSGWNGDSVDIAVW